MNDALYRSMHARGLTQAVLAEKTGIHRTVLARILTNEHGRGKESRHKLAPHLTSEEWGILGWPFEDWQKNGGVPMEQSSTTNIVPSECARCLGSPCQCQLADALIASNRPPDVQPS